MQPVRLKCIIDRNGPERRRPLGPVVAPEHNEWRDTVYQPNENSVDASACKLQQMGRTRRQMRSVPITVTTHSVAHHQPEERARGPDIAGFYQRTELRAATRVTVAKRGMRIRPDDGLAGWAVVVRS